MTRTTSLDLGTNKLNAGIAGELWAAPLSLERKTIVVEVAEFIDEKGNLVLNEKEQGLVKSYLRKVDMRVVPITAILYLLAVMDRANIGAAKVSDMEEDLGLTPTDFSLVTSMFFIAYIIFQIPSNMMLKVLSPSRWIPTIVVLWSCICMGMAFVQSAAGLIALRFFLGAFEAGFTPGVIFMMSFFYTRSQQGLRNSLFFSAGTISGVIGGPLAVAIKSIPTGLQGWQTIFLLEGAISAVAGIASFFLLPSYPETSKFLTEDERAVALRVIKHDQGLAAGAKIRGKQVLNAALDWKLWVFGVMFFCVNLGTVAIAIFSPTIISDSMGYSGDAALLLSAVPSFTGLIGQLTTGWLMGKIAYSYLLMVAGIATFGSVLGLMFVASPVAKMVFLALAGLFAFPVIPLVATWTSLSMGSVTKRGIGSAFIVMCGGVAGAVTSFLFPSSDKPYYYLGMGMFAGSFLLIAVLSLVMRVYFIHTNKKRQDNPEDISHLTSEQVEDLCDRNPSFRYAY
jgi:sugar phosphate permease